MKRKLVLALIDERIRDIIARLDEMSYDADGYAESIHANMCILEELRELRDEIRDA